MKDGRGINVKGWGIAVKVKLGSDPPKAYLDFGGVLTQIKLL